MSRVDVIAGPPGSGKTRQTLEGLGNRKALVLVARHNLAMEAHSYLPDALIIRPKVYVRDGKIVEELSGCPKPDVIRQLRDRGEGYEETRTCKDCRQRKKCPYVDQFKQKQKSWIMVHDHAVLKTEHNDPEVVVIDESILAKVVTRLDLDFTDISGVNDFLRAQGYIAASNALAVILDLMRDLGSYAGDQLVHLIESVVGDLAPLCSQILDPTVISAWLAFRKQHDPPKDYLIDLFEAIKDQATYRVHGRVWLAKRKFFIFKRLDLQLPNVQTIILDSGTDRVILEHLFPNREIHIHDFESPSPTRLIQIPDGYYGKTTLTGTGGARESIFREIKQIIGQIASQDPEHVFGVITFKGIIDELKRSLQDYKVVYGYFWAEKGTNEFSDAGVKTLFVVGTPTPPFSDVFGTACGFFWPDQKVFSDLDYQWRPYGMNQTALDYEVTTLMPVDPLYDAFLRQGRGNELMQSVGRIRPYTDPAGKKVIVYSCLPIPRFPPTELIERKDLFKILGLKRPGRPSSEVKLEEYLQSYGELVSQLGRSPTYKELAEHTGLPRRTLARRERARRAFLEGDED